MPNFPIGYTRPYGPIDPISSRLETRGGEARRPSATQPLSTLHTGHIAPPHRRPPVIAQAYLQYTEQGKLTKSRPYSPGTQRVSLGRNRVSSLSRSQQDREDLIRIMRSNCRNYTAVGGDGRYRVSFDMRERYQKENHVLRMINHKIRDLKPEDRVAVLGTFIDHHLPHMLHSSTVKYDLQRKAIKMLAELLPTVIHNPNDKARLLASLIRQLNSNGISTERKTDAGFLGASGRPNSDLAAKLIENELKAVRGKARKCTRKTLGRLAGSFNDALRGYDALNGRWSSLHTKQWQNTFRNPELAPWNW